MAGGGVGIDLVEERPHSPARRVAASAVLRGWAGAVVDHETSRNLSGGRSGKAVGFFVCRSVHNRRTRGLVLFSRSDLAGPFGVHLPKMESRRRSNGTSRNRRIGRD